MIDASAAFDYLLDNGLNGDWARTIVNRETELGAPHLIDLEVVSALRRRVRRSELTPERARGALADFSDLGLIRYPVTTLLAEIWALRAALNPYDAAYVVLSEVLAAPLVTTDARLARSQGHRAEIVAP